MRAAPLAWTLSALLLAACGERAPEPPPGPPPASSWTELDPARLSPAQQAQAARATKARESLASRLLTRLQGALREGGPGAAIGVCRSEAPRIAAEVGREQGLSLGRTSHRLRNRSNAVPEWAERAVATRREAPLVLAHADGRLAALHPIRVQAACLACHGAPEALAPAAREALERDYPSDQATGFAEGDLRGWFWVEVPAAP